MKSMSLREYLEEQVNEDLILAVLSSRRENTLPEKVRLRPVLIKGRVLFQAERFSGKQVFHTNYTREEALSFLEKALASDYGQLQCRGRELSGSVRVSRKGKASVMPKREMITEAVRIAPQNRVKQYILKEGTAVPFLQDLGVMTADGKVVAKRYDKFRQINRFLEFIDDVADQLPKDREITVLDFGCGKSYLTFAMYYYFRELRNMDVRIIGLDLKEDVIESCSRLAEDYGYEKLSFMTGDVADFHMTEDIDMMVTLHACDTATDYALFRGIQWGAKVILCVPCCQHEVNRQIANDLLEPVLRYGILKERMAVLITDGLRAELLCACGYDTQVLEFIDMEHTPKNLLLRAVRTGKKKDGKAAERLIEALHIDPALYRLIRESAGE